MANANIVTLQDEVGNEMFPRTLASAVFSSTGNPIATQDVLCTQEEYDSFPDTKLTDGKKYFIDDGMTPQQRADGVFYDDTDTQLGSDNVQGAISALNSNLTNSQSEIDTLNTLLTNVQQPLTSVNNNVSIVYQSMHLLNGQWFGCVMVQISAQLPAWTQILTGLKTIPTNASYGVFAGASHFQRHYAGFIQTDSGGIQSGTYMIIIPC